MEIKSISKKIFRAETNKIANNGSHTNPFGVNFQGQMIKADVFETEAKSNAVTNVVSGLAEKVSNRGKMVISAIVGSMGDVTTGISTRLDKVVDFGNRMKDGAANLWKQMNETKIEIKIGSPESLLKMRMIGSDYITYSRRNLDRMGVSDLASMLKETVAAKEAA